MLWDIDFWNFDHFRPKSAITRLVQPPSLHQTGGFRDGRFNGAIQSFIGSTLVAMVTKIRPFSTQIGPSSSCTNAGAAEIALNGVFGDGRFIGAIQIFIGPTLVAMVTKIRPFSTQIGHNSACTNARAAEFAPNRVFFGGTTELMVPFKFSVGWSLLSW